MANNNSKKKNLKSVKKLDIKQKIVPILLAGAVLTGVGASSYKLGKMNGEKNNSIVCTDENLEGYDSIGILGTGKVKDYNFVILDIGDHNTVETSFQKRKMKLCNDKNISLGVIISSDAENESDIYNDVDYVKGIVRDYKIDFPVYLNIDKIVNNEKLSNSDKWNIINDFLVKCSKNGFYVGLNGTDTNLCKLQEFFDTTAYDAYLVMDKENISYTGKYSVYKNLDGDINSNFDISQSICYSNLNNSSRFLSDGYFIANSKEDLADISMKYGMSEEDLLKFNEVKSRELKKGKIIRVPSVNNNVYMAYDNQSSNESNNYELVDEYLKGCDISYCQANNSNWDQLKENFDFVILKCSQGLTLDPYFERNANACNSCDIPMGVYVYNDYWKERCSLEQFKELQQVQADFAVSSLVGKNVSYPVYLDIEKQGFNSDNDLPKEYANAMLDIWYNTIKKAGYIPGLYFNRSVAGVLENLTDYKLSDKFEVWLAGGPQYEARYDDGSHIRYEINDIDVPDFFINNEYGCSMCQPGMVVNAGSGTSEGILDFDYCKVDYSNSKKKKNVNTKYIDNIKEFSRTDKFVPITCVGLSALGIAGFGIRKKIRKKEEEKKKAKSKTKKK